MNPTDSPSCQYLPQPRLYRSKYPNQPMLLYKGFAEIILDEKVFEGNATVLLVWFPYPHAKFEFTYFGKTEVELDDFTLKLTELGVSALVSVSEKRYYGAGSKYVISGYFSEPVVQGSQKELASLAFYIPNFPFFDISNTWGIEEEEEEQLEGWLELYFEGQFVFQVDEWRIILATLPDSWDIHDLLRTQGGYALTHMCKLERSDRSPFSLEDAREQLQAFSFYLSFARGIWIAPILLFGYDAQGEQVFEEWSDCLADSWQNTCEWFSPDSTELVQAFPGFMQRWNSLAWRELIQESIQWYVESSKQAGGAEGAIVLQQAALERLAWVFLVEEKRNLSKDGFHKLSAADKIRQLLSHLEIKLEIPARLNNIKNVSKAVNWDDGPQAITEIRNAIIHPDPKKRHKGSGASPVVKNEAWNLGLQYLELVLLKLFNYPYAYLYDLEED